MRSGAGVAGIRLARFFAAIFRPAAAPQEPFRIDCDLELSERNDMTNDKTIPIAWLLAGVLTVTIVFNGIALALS
jgi:hypothetical protein